MPLARHTFKRVGAAIVEAEVGAGDQILDRAGDEDLARPRQRGYPRPDMHRDPADAIWSYLDLAGVQPRADLKAERPHRLADAAGTANRPRRAVEGCEEAVSRRVDFGASVALQLLPDERVMLLLQPPASDDRQAPRRARSSRQCP